MEEKNNFTFNEVVGETVCQFDGQLWYFKNKGQKMVIPVKSISNVAIKKEASWIWLIIVLVAILVLIFGKDIFSEDWMTFTIAGIIGIIAYLLYLFSLHFTLLIIPHSGIPQKIDTRKKDSYKALYDALVNSIKQTA